MLRSSDVDSGTEIPALLGHSHSPCACRLQAHPRSTTAPTTSAGSGRPRLSIQGLLEDALAPLDGDAVTVHGAGRTDAGVHALGQVASVTHRPRRIDDRRRWCARSMRTCPPTSASRGSRRRRPDFTRASARVAKTYEYRIVNAPDVLSRSSAATSGTCPEPLDLDGDAARRRTAGRAARLRRVPAPRGTTVTTIGADDGHRTRRSQPRTPDALGTAAPGSL